VKSAPGRGGGEYVAGSGVEKIMLKEGVWRRVSCRKGLETEVYCWMGV